MTAEKRTLTVNEIVRFNILTAYLELEEFPAEVAVTLRSTAETLRLEPSSDRMRKSADLCLKAADQIDKLVAGNLRLVTPTQRAYALLWRSMTPCTYANDARKVLLSSMTEEEQRAAVAWLVNEAGPVTDAEMIAADIRGGIFPRKTF